MRIRFTPAARAAFLAEIDYIRRDRPNAAAKLYAKSGQLLRRLEEFPQSGRKIPEFPDLPYRELLVTPYQFFYRIERETIWVVAVWHDAQLPQAPEEVSTP